MDSKNITTALLIFFIFLLWSMFGHACCTKYRGHRRIKNAIARLELHNIRIMHERAHTIDFNKYNISPAQRDFFRSCVARRYQKEIIKPVMIKVSAQEKVFNRIRSSQSLSALDSEIQPVEEKKDPIRIHASVVSVIE